MRKAREVRDAMRRHPGKVVVFIDVDCTVTAGLSPLADLRGDVEKLHRGCGAVGIFLLFGGLLAVMLLQATVMQHQKYIMQEMRDDMGRIKTQLWVLSVAMDATNEKLGEVITEHVEASVIKAQDDAAERAEAELVPDTRSPTQILDEAA